jgi:hypothetical protein
MSRSKKSRKPGGAPTAKPKLSKKELANVEKRVRKPTGNVAGNRQKEGSRDKTINQQTAKQKDPRLGNKTPIVLSKADTQAEQSTSKKIHKTTLTPVASVRVINPDEKPLSAEQELDLIEQDQCLQEILAKLEADLVLTKQEVAYYNQKMDRHQALSVELGIYNESSEDTESNEQQVSEDELWQKLDNTDFSDFEDKES